MQYLLLPAFFSLFLSLASTLSIAQLSPSFYGSSCPSAVSTITQTIVSVAKKDNVVAPSTLRLILHDCFVEGCDGSVLLSSTSENKAERDAADNSNLPQNAFDAIIAAKKAVEQICPGVVSCADILALAARDVVVFLGGPSWDVPLGRLDGRISTASSVAGRLPLANMDVKQLTDNFASVGLGLQEMVILSGAHTVGFSHCDQFKNRLYSFNSSAKLDPSIDPGFAQQLQKQCPANGGDNLQQFDAVSPFNFDNSYFKDLQQGKGLLLSDQVLFLDASTKTIVDSMAAAQDAFFKGFAAAMIKMTSIGVKGAGQGEVRKDCTVVNPGGLSKPSPSTPAASNSQPPPSPPVKPSSPPALPQQPPVTSASPPPHIPNTPPPQIQQSPPPPPPPRPTPVSLPPPSSPPPPSTPVQDPSPPNSPNQPPRGGITIPGIPGFTAPIHLRFPGFGLGPPPAGSSSRSRKSVSKNS